jgi:CHAD domain-containing protein
VERLEAAGARDGGTTPKLIQAVGGPALDPPDVVEPVLADEPAAGAVIQAALARSVTRLLLHLPAARVGQDIEGVHQARVATRRLRSDLHTFRPLLDEPWARRLQQDLRWLADDLGRVRDADVLLDRLRATINKHPELSTDGAQGVLKALERQRSGDNRTLRRHLDQRRADHLLDQLVQAAQDPTIRPEADAPARDTLPTLVDTRWRRLQRAVEALGPEPEIEALHRVRILAKRTRYASEAVVPAVGQPARRLAKAMAGLQDELGELNDAAVAEEWLAELADTVDGAVAFAAGRLAHVITSDNAHYRQSWQRHYRKVGGIEIQSWTA